MILSLLPLPPAPTIVQSVISPHPVKFIVGMMYCVLEEKVPVPVPSDGAGGIDGMSQVPNKSRSDKEKTSTALITRSERH